MRLLRKSIRNLIFEIYKLNPKEERAAADLEWDAWARRALGLQWPEEIEKERSFLQEYQAKLRSNPEGKKLIEQFRNGSEITIIHGINYAGYASGHGYKSSAPFKNTKSIYSDWIKAHGRKGKDVLSCVASGRALGQDFLIGRDNSQAAKSFGFIMKGYPVLVSETDVMSQTLGALPIGLVQHQKSSGIAKRAEPSWRNVIVSPGFRWAGEVLLDNWQIIGTYFNINSFDMLDFRHVLTNSMDLGIPAYVYDEGVFLGKVEEMDSYWKVFYQAFQVPF